MNKQQPSPECYSSNLDNTEEEPVESPIENTTIDVVGEEPEDEKSTNQFVQNLEEDEVAEDEVIIVSNSKGDLMARTSQVTDYCL